MDESDFIPFGSSANGDKELLSTPVVLINNLRVPWLSSSIISRIEESEKAPLVRLHNEILTFCDYISPTTLELQLREDVLQEIRDIVMDLWPTCVVHVFGSQMTKILTPTSDLDIAVLSVPTESGDILEQLAALAEKIVRKDIASYCEAITNAKVPIVKLDHKKSGISIDICINNDSGLYTGKTIKKLVKGFPPLRPLTIILKVFLAQRRLNDTYTGGVGSFMLSCLVASFLQMKLKNSICLNLTPSWNLGGLLLEFFQLYGTTFNYYTVGISLREGGNYFSKKSRKEDNVSNGNVRYVLINETIAIRQVTEHRRNHLHIKQNLLWLENPDSPELDIGRSSFMLPKVRRAFEHAQQCLLSSLTDYHSHKEDSLLSFIIRADDPSLLGR